MAQIMTLAAIKGGTGKTATCGADRRRITGHFIILSIITRGRSMEREELEKCCYDKAIGTGLYDDWKDELKAEIHRTDDSLLLDYLEKGEE